MKKVNIRIVLKILIFFISLKIFATAQSPDKIIINGKKEKLHSNPLETFFEKNEDKRPKDGMRSTALWRGYIATFEIKESQLFVIDIEIEIAKNNKNKAFKTIWKSVFNEVFPNQKEVKVDWFMGLLIIPKGDRISYVHMGYGSTYEEYTILEIENGNLKKERNFDHVQFRKFKEKQFIAYKNTEDYLKRKKMFEEVPLEIESANDSIVSNNNENSEISVDSFLKTFVIEYSSKILDDTEIPKKTEFDSRLVGLWEGSEKNQERKNIEKKWKMERRPNGTYTINFKFEDEGEINEFSEQGTWWTEGNIFYEFHETSGLTDEYIFEVLDKKNIKFKISKSSVNFNNPEYTFIDTLIKK